MEELYAQKFGKKLNEGMGECKTGLDEKSKLLANRFL